MSLMLLDKDGNGGQLCTLRGLDELGTAAKGLKATNRFLEDGEIRDSKTQQEIETEIVGIKPLAQLGAMLRGGQAPWVLTDGVVDEGDEAEVKAESESVENTRRALVNRMARNGNVRSKPPTVPEPHSTVPTPQFTVGPGLVVNRALFDEEPEAEAVPIKAQEKPVEETERAVVFDRDADGKIVMARVVQVKKG